MSYSFPTLGLNLEAGVRKVDRRRRLDRGLEAEPPVKLTILADPGPVILSRPNSCQLYKHTTLYILQV